MNNFDGLIIHPNVPGVQVVHETRNQVWLEVGAGEDWDRFVDYCVKSEYYGLENLSLIPGTVGAAPVQNIGAYGVEVKDFVDTVNGFDLESMSTYSIPAEQCRFAYRNSIFKQELKNRFVVTSVVFRLEKFPEFKLDYGTLKAEVEARAAPDPCSRSGDGYSPIKIAGPGRIGQRWKFLQEPGS